MDILDSDSLCAPELDCENCVTAALEGFIPPLPASVSLSVTSSFPSRAVSPKELSRTPPLDEMAVPTAVSCFDSSDPWGLFPPLSETSSLEPPILGSSAQSGLAYVHYTPRRRPSSLDEFLVMVRREPRPDSPVIAQLRVDNSPVAIAEKRSVVAAAGSATVWYRLAPTAQHRLTGPDGPGPQHRFTGAFTPPSPSLSGQAGGWVAALDGMFAAIELRSHSHNAEARHFDLGPLNDGSSAAALPKGPSYGSTQAASSAAALLETEAHPSSAHEPEPDGSSAASFKEETAAMSSAIGAWPRAFRFHAHSAAAASGASCHAIVFSAPDTAADSMLRLPLPRSWLEVERVLDLPATRQGCAAQTWLKLAPGCQPLVVLSSPRASTAASPMLRAECLGPAGGAGASPAGSVVAASGAAASSIAPAAALPTADLERAEGEEWVLACTDSYSASEWPAPPLPRRVPMPASAAAGSNEGSAVACASAVACESAESAPRSVAPTAGASVARAATPSHAPALVPALRLGAASSSASAAHADVSVFAASNGRHSHHAEGDDSSCVDSASVAGSALDTGRSSARPDGDLFANSAGLSTGVANPAATAAAPADSVPAAAAASGAINGAARHHHAATQSSAGAAASVFQLAATSGSALGAPPRAAADSHSSIMMTPAARVRPTFSDTADLTVVAATLPIGTRPQSVEPPLPPLPATASGGCVMPVEVHSYSGRVTGYAICLTAIPAFMPKSIEELRLEDYAIDRRGLRTHAASWLGEPGVVLPFPRAVGVTVIASPVPGPLLNSSRVGGGGGGGLLSDSGVRSSPLADSSVAAERYSPAAAAGAVAAAPFTERKPQQSPWARAEAVSESGADSSSAPSSGHVEVSADGAAAAAASSAHTSATGDEAVVSSVLVAASETSGAAANSSGSSDPACEADASGIASFAAAATAATTKPAKRGLACEMASFLTAALEAAAVSNGPSGAADADVAAASPLSAAVVASLPEPTLTATHADAGAGASTHAGASASPRAGASGLRCLACASPRAGASGGARGLMPQTFETADHDAVLGLRESPARAGQHDAASHAPAARSPSAAAGVSDVVAALAFATPATAGRNSEHAHRHGDDDGDDFAAVGSSSVPSTGRSSQPGSSTRRTPGSGGRGMRLVQRIEV